MGCQVLCWAKVDGCLSTPRRFFRVLLTRREKRDWDLYRTSKAISYHVILLLLSFLLLFVCFTILWECFHLSYQHLFIFLLLLSFFLSVRYAIPSALSCAGAGPIPQLILFGIEPTMLRLLLGLARLFLNGGWKNERARAKIRGSSSL